MDKTASGWVNGFLGMLIFSGSLPATRAAVAAFDPVFLTVARAGIAGLLALALLLVFRQKRPGRGDMISLAVVACGVVIGFPLLTALALKHVTSAHSVVFIALLPLSTAIFGVIRGGERPRPGFLVVFMPGGRARRRLCSGSGSRCFTSRRPVDDCGNRCLRTGLCRRRQAVAHAWRMAGDFLGAGALAADHGAVGPRHHAVDLGGRRTISLDRARLCVVVQHADRLHVLVSRPGAGRHCGRRAVAASPALFRLVLAATLLHESVAWSMVAVATAVVLCVVGAKRFAR